MSALLKLEISRETLHPAELHKLHPWSTSGMSVWCICLTYGEDVCASWSLSNLGFFFQKVSRFGLSSFGSGSH